MEVEVVFPQVCGAFYKAFLIDIDLANGKAKVGFPKNWRPVEWADLSQIRYPADGEHSGGFTIGCKVEALLPHHDNESPGWWTGVLIKSRGELSVVEFQSGSEKYQDIVEAEKLRVPNESPPLSKVKLLTKDFTVPEEITDYCQRTGVHENFRAKIKALCVVFKDSGRTLTVVAGDDDCLEKANILIDMHFKDLNTQMSLLARNEAVAQKLSNSMMRDRQAEHRGVVEVRFYVPQDLVGLAIGRDGGNVNEARKYEGITSIEFDDPSSMFCIRGESRVAVLKARERLEYAKETILVPRTLAGKIIGKKGNVISDILEKSRVNNVKVVGDEEAKKRNIDPAESVGFEFVGRKKCIEHAKLMMDYHIDHLKDVENILQTRREMGHEDDTPTFFPRPSEERRREGRRGGRGRREYGNQGERTNSESKEPPKQEEQESDSDSGPSVEVESDDNRKSSPEEDNQPPPDRRRQRAPARGGGGRGRGRGGYRRSRQGRGGGRGGGRGPREATKKETEQEPPVPPSDPPKNAEGDDPPPPATETKVEDPQQTKDSNPPPRES